MDTLEIPNVDNLPKDSEDHDVEKCKVCAHQNRRAIEELYVQGLHVWILAKRNSIRPAHLKKHLEWSGSRERLRNDENIEAILGRSGPDSSRQNLPK